MMMMMMMMMMMIKPQTPFLIYILQYLHLDVRRNILHVIAIYISYYEYVPSLRMASIAETCC